MAEQKYSARLGLQEPYSHLPTSHVQPMVIGVPDGDAQQFLYKLHALNCLRTAITVRNALTFSITNVKFTLMPPVVKHGPIATPDQRSPHAAVSWAT